MALLTDMNQVLGRTAGNAVEVRESIDHLTGRARDERLLEVTLALCAEVLVLGGPYLGSGRARPRPPSRFTSGRAADRFGAMVVELGGPANLLDTPSSHLRARPSCRRSSRRRPGVVSSIDVRAVGIAIVNLGGGRAREDDVVDHSVGLTEVAALGERVDPAGRPLALVHARDEESARRAADAVRSAFTLGDPPGRGPGPGDRGSAHGVDAGRDLAW